MKLGLDQGIFYAEYESCRWPVGTIRQECDRRAVDIAKHSNKIVLGMSSGLDSQIVLLSFLQQHIPIEKKESPSHRNDDKNDDHKK